MIDPPSHKLTTIGNPSSSNIMSEDVYSMSFTAGALLIEETITVGEVFQEYGNWTKAREEILENNLLRMRSNQSSNRIYKEVSARLRYLTESEFRLLFSSSRQEQGYILWLATCKRYRYIYDFAATVIHEKYLRLDYELTKDNYEIYFNQKAEWHPEVEATAPSTREKLRQIIFKMLKEADLLTPDNQINPIYMSPELISAIQADDPHHFLIFPISPTFYRADLNE